MVPSEDSGATTRPTPLGQNPNPVTPHPFPLPYPTPNPDPGSGGVWGGYLPRKEGRYKATWKREFTLPWRKAGLLKSSR